MGSRKRKWQALEKLAALSILAAGIILQPIRARAQEEVVRLGDLVAISNVAIYAAVEKGYFKEQGIRTTIETFASAAKMLPALTAGEMEVSVGTPSVGFFNAVREGGDFRIVADKGQFRPGHGYAMLTVRKDLVESGQVKTIKDMKGRKIAQTAKGIVLEYAMGKMLEEVGLTIKDVQYTFLTAPNQITALETKTVEATFTTEPWGARSEEKGVGVRFRSVDMVKGMGPVQAAVIIYAGKFIKERRPVAQRWMNAYLKGAEFFVAKGAQDPEVLAILEKYTKIPAKTIRAAIAHYQARDGKVVIESLVDQMKWYVANGYMAQEVPVEKVVDLSFLR